MKFLALGDSYTIGESVQPHERWPVLLCETLTLKGGHCESPQIIATTGWRTDDLKNAIISNNPPKDFDLVSLLIGVNNQYQGRSAGSYAPEFEELLQMAVALAGGNKSNVFVVSIPDYGFTPFGKEKQSTITREIDQFNKVNREISEKFDVRYFNITPLSRLAKEDPELVAEDGLHPSGKQYRQWAKLIADGLSQIKNP